MDFPPLPKPGTDPEKDAWIANFYMENHLAYEAFPYEVASPEQLKFMVWLEDEPYFYPCTDETFHSIINKTAGESLVMRYMRVWEKIEPLVKSLVEDSYRRAYLLFMLRIKFRRESAPLVMLPTRLEKRLLQIFVRVSEISRPLAREKEAMNRRVADLLESDSFKMALNDLEGLDSGSGTDLGKLNIEIIFLQLKRLLFLTAHPELWTGSADTSVENLRRLMKGPESDITRERLQRLKEFIKRGTESKETRYYLWMGPSAGSVMLDIAIIRILIKLNIKVIMSVKHAFYYHAVTMDDVIEDPVLQHAIEDADIITSTNISKNDLIDHLKSDKNLFVISDGTQERFNPLLTSVTFARAFKECDHVISRHPDDSSCMLKTRFQFTRDITVITSDRPGSILIEKKPHHPKVIRFSEKDLRMKAQAMIMQLRMAKKQGKTIMFYSAIVGSIPHQIETAKRILNVFVNYLREKQEGVVVINPGEHFEKGMDADDIMYMWEIVQRSGVIDIWRFQTVQDIEKAFELMGEKVPPEWVGKDATYSTGCTKEMQIAMEVQKQYPEMQIIGPSWEKFMRRKEYGVGKLYDRAFGEL